MLSKKVLTIVLGQFDSAAKDNPICLAVFGGFAALTKAKDFEIVSLTLAIPEKFKTRELQALFSAVKGNTAVEEAPDNKADSLHTGTTAYNRENKMRYCRW